MTDPSVYAAANPSEERDRGPSPPHASNRALWFAVFGPPAAWTIDELTAIAVDHDYCAALLGHTVLPWNGVGVILAVLGLVMLGVSLAALLSCALFSFAIALRLIAPFLLTPAYCGS